MVPIGMTSVVHAFDAREGGQFRVTLTYDEPTGMGKTTAHSDTYHGRFVRLQRDQLVIETMEFESANPAMCGQMTVTFTLTDASGGTEVVAVHDNLPQGISPTDNETGWRMALDKLAALVEAEQEGGILDCGDVILRPYEERDHEAIVTILGDGDVMQRALDERPLLPDDADRFILDHFRLRDRLELGTVALKSTGLAIGFSGYRACGYLGEEDIEFGWVLGKAHHGRGYATRLGQRLIARALGAWTYARVLAACHPLNVASEHVLRDKLQMEFEGEVEPRPGFRRRVYSATRRMRERVTGRVSALALTLATAVLTSFCGADSKADPRLQAAARLYVFDCGTLERADISRFRLKAEEVATIRMSVACFLVVHPRGTLMWDVGAVPDTEWKPTGSAVLQRVVLPDSQQREVTMVKPLGEQLREIGFSAGQITYVALSHYHWDHTANANDFVSSTWLVRQVERDAMFAADRPALLLPATYAALKGARTVVIGSDEHDVFGDGSVILKLAPGHTPGHQVLYVKLPQTGGVVLSGDLYHYPEERTLGRVPTFEFDPAQTAVARAAIDAFLQSRDAQLWIQHDFTANARLRKAPQYYQ